MSIGDGYEPYTDDEDECEGAPDEDEPEDDDHWQEYKDGVAMGYINPDGTQREPDEPDFGAEDYWQHCADEHRGKACDCPPSSDNAWALPEGETYDTESPF